MVKVASAASQLSYAQQLSVRQVGIDRAHRLTPSRSSPSKRHISSIMVSDVHAVLSHFSGCLRCPGSHPRARCSTRTTADFWKALLQLKRYRVCRAFTWLWMRHVLVRRAAAVQVTADELEPLVARTGFALNELLRFSKVAAWILQRRINRWCWWQLFQKLLSSPLTRGVDLQGFGEFMAKFGHLDSHDDHLNKRLFDVG